MSYKLNPFTGNFDLSGINSWIEILAEMPTQTFTRNGDGVITSWVVDGVTFTPTYSGGLMTSYTDGTSTWTIGRNANNQITSITKS